MALTDSLRILITANGAQAEREFTKVGAAARRSLGQAENSTQRWGRTLTSAGVAMATFGGVALVGLYKAAQAAQEEDLAIAKLNNSIANSPELAGASSAAFLDQAAALQDVTTFADDATIAAQAMLGTFHLTQDEVLGLTPLVQDLAAKFDLDLVEAAKQVGKAMAGNVGALQRNGVMIDEAAFATDRYSAVVQALRENAGGFAEEEGATFNGQLQIMKNNLGDVAEGIGRGVVESLNSLLGPVTAVSDAFQSLDPETQSLVGKIATFGAVGLTAAGGISFLAGQVLTAVSRFQQMQAASATSLAVLRAAAFASPAASLGVLGIAAATAAVAFGDFGSSSEEVTTDVEGLTRALQRQETEVGNLSQQWLVDFFANGGDGARHLAESLAEAGVGFDELDRAMAMSIEDYNDWQLALQQDTDFEIFSADDSTLLATLHRDRTAASDAAVAMDELAGATDNAGTAARRLGDEWSGLDDRLSDFNAALDAQQALYGLQDAVAAAGEDGNITAREMLDLNQSLSGLVESYARVAEANNTAADGTVNFRGRNRELRSSLGALAAFIPAQLRPQFRQLTQDVLSVSSAVTGVPNDLTIVARMVGTDGVLNDLQRIYGAAVQAANAVGQTGGSLAGGGAYTESAPQAGTGTGTTPVANGITESGLARAIVDEMYRRPPPMVTAGSM